MADYLDLDRVLWIPAGVPPHKALGAVSPGAVRVEMVHAAIVSDARFEVSTLETDRPGRSYAVDTVRAVRTQLPDAELFLIVGADQFREFDRWRAPDEILRHVRLAVMDRAGESAEKLAGNVAAGHEALFVPVRRLDISSTAVREAARQGRDLREWVAAGVDAIIEREGLYSGV